MSGSTYFDTLNSVACNFLEKQQLRDLYLPILWELTVIHSLLTKLFVNSLNKLKINWHCDKRHKRHAIITVVALRGLSVMTFVAYDVCRIMTFVAYRVCPTKIKTDELMCSKLFSFVYSLS